MYAILSNGIEFVRKPEYTGENRCYPCTAVNVGIAVIVAGLVGIVFTTAGFDIIVPALVSTVAFVLCGMIIYLRGYLIPGTPTLTKHYLPEQIRQLFDPHHGSEETETEAGDLLVETGVVTDCPNEDDVCLEPSFRTLWRDRIREVRANDDGHERLATHLGVDRADLELEDENGRYWMYYEGNRIDAWPSRAAFLADLAVEPTLREWDDDWDDLDDRERTLIIASLRAFLEQCPACDSDLEAAESAWESCCREGTTVSVSCSECGDEVFSGKY